MAASGGGGFPGPVPGDGQFEQVVLAGYPLRVLPQTWKREPAPRFGEKISTGDLRYQDFNPYESAASYSSFERGFGLRRFSDLPASVDPEGFYAESQNVDCRAPGVCISPAITSVPLPTSPSVTGPYTQLLWFGEWAPSQGAVTTTQWVAVVITRNSPAPGTSYSMDVLYFTAAGAIHADVQIILTVTETLTTVFTPGIVVAAKGQLLAGFGSLHTAQYITTLDQSQPTSTVADTGGGFLYAFAMAQDRAAIYLAGGTASTDVNTVRSAPLTATNPAASFATAANAVTCGDPAHAITALAPGGGVSGVLLFVTKDNELGFIDTSSVYHTVFPFGSTLSTNGRDMRWWLGGSTDNADVGTLLAFPQGHSLWSYNTTAGMTNMAAEGKEGFRPINARGVVTAIQPSTHFLYYAIKNSAGNTYILANDGVTGANHTYRYHTGVTCNAMGITSLFGANPLLYLDLTANGVLNIGYITLPADGDWPPAEDGPHGGNCTFDLGLSNTMLLPDIDFGFPDEDKIPIFLRLVADNLASGAQFIIVDYAVDGGLGYVRLGTYFISPIQDIPFPSLSFKRISLRLTFQTTNTTKTPILNAISLRASINPKQYTLWSFTGVVPSGAAKIGSDALANAHTTINALWADYKAGTPVAFTDRWNKQWLVRMLQFTEDETYQENLQTPGTAMNIQLLELYGTGLESAWDGANTIYDAANLTWG